MTGRGRTLVTVGVMLAIALIHVFSPGDLMRGRMRVLYFSYFTDIVLPFGLYLLLGLSAAQFRFLRDWRAKALVVFGATSLSEVLQGLGVPLFGRVFDPLDFVMFAGGVLLAVVADRLVLERLLSRAG